MLSLIPEISLQKNDNGEYFLDSSYIRNYI